MNTRYRAKNRRNLALPLSNHKQRCDVGIDRHRIPIELTDLGHIADAPTGTAKWITTTKLGLPTTL